MDQGWLSEKHVLFCLGSTIHALDTMESFKLGYGSALPPDQTSGRHDWPSLSQLSAIGFVPIFLGLG